MCEAIRCDDEPEATPSGMGALVDELIAGFNKVRVYAPTHPQVVGTLDRLRTMLAAEHRTHDDATLEIGVADGYLFFAGRPLIAASLSSRRLLAAFETLGSGGLSFERGAGDQDFVALLGLLAARALPVATWREANDRLASEGCGRIRFLPPFETSGTLPGREAAAKGGGAESGLSHDLVPTDLSVPVRIYQDLVDELQEFMVRAYRGQELDLSSSRTHVEAILRQLHADPESLMRVARYEAYSAFTFGHSIRACLLSLRFARAFSPSEAMLHRLGTAVLLHDVGKALVPWDILYAKGQLTPEQRQVVRNHAAWGAQLLLGQGQPDPLVIATTFGHHQTLDLKGYPRTLHRVAHSTATKIVKICDVYEALTAPRPYKPPMSPLRAYRIMMSMGDHFEPEMLQAFVRVNGLYPDGYLVTLSTGETARVLRQTPALQRPVVVVERDRDGEVVPMSDRVVVDLSDVARHGPVLVSAMASTAAAA